MNKGPLLFPAVSRHTATVIFAHGLGDSGYGWAGQVENWRRRQRLDHVKFILPHAPVIPITVNMGMSMPGWYDIKALGSDREAEDIMKSEDKDGVLKSQQYFHSLIQKEIDDGIPADRIVLGGFSQGGAMSIFAGFTATVKLAAIVALSSYVVLSGSFTEHLPKPHVNKATPVFMGHGDEDVVVPMKLGKKSFDFLKKQGFDVSWHEYKEMGHSVCLEELDEVESFLTKALPATQPQADAKSEL